MTNTNEVTPSDAGFEYLETYFIWTCPHCQAENESEIGHSLYICDKCKTGFSWFEVERK